MTLVKAITWTFEHLSEPSIAIFKYTTTGEWVCDVTFGRESENSPIVAGEAIGTGKTLEEAIIDAAEQLPEPGPQVGMEQ